MHSSHLNQKDYYKYLTLAKSCVQQRLEGAKRLPWEVFSENSEKLFELPEDLSDSHIFAIQKYAKLFEENAFKKGIEYSTEIHRRKEEHLKQRFNEEIRGLKDQNEALVQQLVQYIPDDDSEESKIGIPDSLR